MMQNRLLNLLADNRAVRGARRFEVQAAADTATVYLYDMIVGTQAEAEFYGGVSAEAFVKDIAAIDAPVINVRINSPGGDVFAARAMANALKQKKARVVCSIDGYAASAATFIALAGDEVEIADGAMMMVHKSWTVAMGNADDLIATAALLEQIDNAIVKTYAARTGMAEDEVSRLIAAETWLTAQDAVDTGFADRLAEGAPKDQIAWSVSAFSNAPGAPETVEPEPETVEACIAWQDADRVMRHIERIGV